MDEGQALFEYSRQGKLEEVQAELAEGESPNDARPIAKRAILGHSCMRNRLGLVGVVNILGRLENGKG